MFMIIFMNLDLPIRFIYDSGFLFLFRRQVFHSKFNAGLSSTSHSHLCVSTRTSVSSSSGAPPRHHLSAIVDDDLRVPFRVLVVFSRRI
ncbi:hypothetical protein L6452_02283 [Arctium lappa]|uniref:Uncharacterized protein n=1 Tax=Arctium lappa TaxID=4217 RepID=A0ACB9FJT4_ARCLA|nr:hypothetical protein L6452_02283 [Arctium lappa]